MTIPRYVVGTAAEATQILHRLARSGWHPRPGFTVPPSAGPTARIVCYGRIPTQSAAQAAASAAIRGAGVVAIADFASQPGRQLIAALEVHGPVLQSVDAVLEHASVVKVPAMAPDVPAINGLASLLPEQRALLGRLANGETIATAAAAEYLSLRTANRRIAQARTSLGVRTTREAVLVFLHQRRPE
ncbi:MAG TPA: LuxR family transcriptional regulator [Micromonosporaceae bacterium]|jgi:DNA-binding NarL/FixJ family response regulator|nr:LuxR family transcriptional regulator [Micromonosporaceae bacterium]